MREAKRVSSLTDELYDLIPDLYESMVDGTLKEQKSSIRAMRNKLKQIETSIDTYEV